MRPLYQLLLGRVGIYQQGQKLVQFLSLFLSSSLSLSPFLLFFSHILSSESMMLCYDKVSMCFVVKTKKT